LDLYDVSVLGTTVVCLFTSAVLDTIFVVESMTHKESRKLCLFEYCIGLLSFIVTGHSWSGHTRNAQTFGNGIRMIRRKFSCYGQEWLIEALMISWFSYASGNEVVASYVFNRCVIFSWCVCHCEHLAMLVSRASSFSCVVLPAKLYLFDFSVWITVSEFIHIL